MNENRCQFCWKKNPIRYRQAHIDRFHKEFSNNKPNLGKTA